METIENITRLRVKPELSIIKAFLSHSVWEQHNEYITAKDMPADLQLLYRTLDSWHKTNEQDIHLLDLANLFFSNNVKDKAFYGGVFDTLSTYDPNLSTVQTLLTSIKRSTILREISIAAYEVAEGKKAYEQMVPLLQALETDEKADNDGPSTLVTDDLETLVNKVYLSPGLRWRLNTLNRMLGSLRQGNLLIVFARPETGKTTFLASEVSFMAQQLADDECILWINNEEVHENVKLRIYQAVFGVALEQLMSNMVHYNEQYKKLVGSRIKMVNMASFTKNDIQTLCKRFKPKLIVVDQLSKINGFEADRDDLVLGAKAQWARELAKMYGPVIGVFQADASGENQKWLTMNNVANAKTAIQAEADAILGIGCIHDTGWEKMRFLHLSKNKLPGDPDTEPPLRHGKCEVLLEASIARYEDIGNI